METRDMLAETLQDFAIKHADQFVQKAVRGDDRAFNQLVGLWYKRIYNFCFKYFRDHYHATEATQKTFIATHKGIKRLKNAESFKPWLYRIALNNCHEEDRRMKRRSWFTHFSSSGGDESDIKTLEKSAEGHFFNPEEEYTQKEREEIILDHLGRLPEEQRIVVIMKEYEGLKFREIAEALNISENTAKSRLYYGLKSLRKFLMNSSLFEEYRSHEN